MLNKSQQDQPVVSTIVETDEEKFQRLMKDAGFVAKPKVEELSPEAKVSRLQELETLLTQAKAIQDEKAGKKIRRQMRKLGFKRSVWLRNLKAEFTS